MLTTSLIGIVGAVVLAVAWIPEIIEIVRIKASKLNPKFAVISWFGTFLLLCYSLLIMNIIFIAVNFFILLEVSISLYYEFVVEPKNKRKNGSKKR